VNLVVAAETCPADNPGCFHVPSLEELFELPAFLFEDSAFFAFNKTAALYLLAAVIAISLMLIAFRNPKLVPGKFQAAMEAIVEFVRESIVMQVIGPDGLRFVPFLTSLFLFIWINNFFEVAPLIQFPSTGRMAVPAMLAFVVFAVYWAVAFKAQGLAFIKNTAIPPGVPAFVLPLVIPIELAQVLIIRPLTLAIRLFANMMAGHILLAILFIATNAFLINFHGEFSFNLAGSPIGLIALVFGPAMVAFEIMVGVLQAYIFTILAAVYIGGSLHPEH
jgi:F-type H+-transporting ATPase subunit a